MKKKSSKIRRLRLSPNEEAQLVKEELDRRRKLRLQQVREQERYIAQQVRTQVRERRETQLQILGNALHQEWQQERTDKLQSLARAYEESLRSVGHAHRSAQENESAAEVVAQQSMERLDRAADRHQQALRELIVRRREEEGQRCRHIEARKKALLEEKRRALRVASLPPPLPKLVESIGVKARLPLKQAPAESFSVTHHHMPATAVDRETETEQMDARQAAEVVVQRLEEVQREEARDRLEKLEKARLRGNHALKKEQDTQNRTRLLGELERLQQADLLCRRYAVTHIPAQNFQPLYRQEELWGGQQRDLEIAFHDMFTEESKVRGGQMLQLVPEPLPQPPACSHNEDLDVTLDPEREELNTVTETLVSSGPSEDPGRRPLKRLLDHIRNQRDQARQSTAVEATYAEDDVTDVLSIEAGTLSSWEEEQAGSIEEQTLCVTESEEVPEVSYEPIVAGMIPLAEEETHVMPVSIKSEKKECVNQQTDAAELLRQQQEQLVLLEELEAKRRELEWHLKEAQQERQLLDAAAQERSEFKEVSPLPELAPEVTTADTHTLRLHQYQQRLLEQNRRHKKCVEDARSRLEEYQHILKLRHTIGISTAAQTLQQSSICPLHHPNIGSPVHTSSLEKDFCLSQQAFFSPKKPVSSDVINPSVLQSVWPLEGKNSEETSPDARHHRICVFDREQVPLPPPSVVLELLRSRQHRAAHADVCDMLMPSFNTTPAQNDKGEEAAREHGGGMNSANELTLMNTMLKDIEESSGHTDIPCHGLSLLPVSNECAYEQQVPVSRGKMKPPVSRPSARLDFLQQMEVHELSAIQEVDTPVNISLDAEVSGSSSVSLPAVVSDGSVSERSQVTGRISRMSWREAFLNASTSSNNQQLELGVNVAPDRSSVDVDCLSSTTVSTGSFSTSEHEPNCNITEQVGREYSVFHPSLKSTSCQALAMKGSVQQIIDKYTKDLDASLRINSEHTGVNISSVSWSSILQQDLSHDEYMYECQSSNVDLSKADLTGNFLPLQSHPDIDSSSSSSSSRNLLSISQSDRGRPFPMSTDQAQASGFSQSQKTSVTSVLQKSIDPQSLVSEISYNSASPQVDVSSTTSGTLDQTATHERSEGGESVLSQPIGRALDMDSSQVFDESNAPAGGLREMTLQQTASGRGLSLASQRVCDVRLSEVSSAALPRSEEDVDVFAEASHDDASDCFLSLPTEVTHNESVECSLVDHILLVAESTFPADTSASDCLEPTNASLLSFASDTSLHRLRADTLIPHKSDLHISVEHLLINNDSLCENDILAPPTASDVSCIRSSPSKISVQDGKSDLAFHLADEYALDRLLDRIQELGDVKGILEESTISFISLPESTFQDPDVPGLEECIERVPEAKPGNKVSEEKGIQGESDLREGNMKGSSPSDCLESSSSHAVVMLQLQPKSASQQVLRRQHNLDKPTSSPDCSIQKLESAFCRLKTVGEIKICTPEQTCLEDVDMCQHTQRLYSQLEEVKHKELHSRGKTKEFQRKMLVKLRAKQK